FSSNPFLLLFVFLEMPFSLYLGFRGFGKAFGEYSHPSQDDLLLDRLTEIFSFPLGWLSKFFVSWAKPWNDILILLSFPLNSLLWGISLYFLVTRIWKWVKTNTGKNRS
ncbi:hypothetical protein V2H45_04765, partial [Tumidithrix elongata RA019]|nr:hypothetical protein [Tumidithrix elongata RA019]